MNNILTLSTSQLRLSEDKQSLLLLISLIKTDVTAANIIDLFEASDYKNFKLNKQGVKDAINCFKEIKQQSNESTNFQSVVIAERQDAQLTITFDLLKITAKAKITAAFDGVAITYKQIMAAINDHNITVGISQSAIKKLLSKAKQGPSGCAYQITIAKGTPMVDGCDTSFECLLNAPKEILVKAINLQYGSVDMSNIGSLISVNEGDQLMRRHPCRKGMDGMTVTGETIKHIAANDYPFIVGKNSVISQSDENLLLAATQGTPIILEHGMEVDELLMLEGLDADSPGIEHKGSLIVAGDICDCQKIVATGDITVIGFIESSKVECGGDLFVSKGILGHPAKNGGADVSSKINCKGSIFANFIQYSNIYVAHDLNIKYQLLHCNVFCEGYINVKDEQGKKGTIFGGYLRANKGICTVILGAPAGIKTTIDLRTLYWQLLKNRNQIQSALDSTEEKLQAVLSAQNKLSKFKDSEKTQLLAERLLITIKETKKQIAKLNNERQENHIEIQQYHYYTKVVALGSLHSEVSCSIGDQTLHSSNNYTSSKISFKNNRLIIAPYLQAVKKQL